MSGQLTGGEDLIFLIDSCRKDLGSHQAPVVPIDCQVAGCRKLKQVSRILTEMHSVNHKIQDMMYSTVYIVQHKQPLDNPSGQPLDLNTLEHPKIPLPDDTPLYPPRNLPNNPSTSILWTPPSYLQIDAKTFLHCD